VASAISTVSNHPEGYGPTFFLRRGSEPVGREREKMYGPFAMLHCHPGKKQVWIGHWRADDDTIAKCAERLADTYHGAAPLWDQVSQRIRMEVLDYVATNVAHRYGIANPMDFCLAADSLHQSKPFAVEPFTLCCSETRRLVVWHIPSVKNITYGVSFMPFSQEIFVGECLLVAYSIDPDDTLCAPIDLPMNIMSKCTPVWHDDIRCNEEHTQDEFTQELLYWCFRAAEKCLADRFAPSKEEAQKEEAAPKEEDADMRSGQKEAPKAPAASKEKKEAPKEEAPPKEKKEEAPPKEEKEEAPPKEAQKVFVLELDEEDMQFLYEIMKPEPKPKKEEPDDVDTLVDYINRGGAPSKKKNPAHRKAVAQQEAKAERRRKARVIELEDPTIRGIRNLLRK
jgi:hypothetical protein